MRIVIALLAFALATSAQTITLGSESSLIGGMSYRNPVEGVFARVDVPIKRAEIVTTTSASNDKKTYNPDGWYFANTTEVGWWVNPVYMPEVVTYFGRQSNSQYVKSMTSIGAGLRARLAPTTDVYAQYIAPDFQSFNHAQRVVIGLDLRVKTRLYIGVQQSVVVFFQPGQGHLAGMEVTARLGLMMGNVGAQ